ncbi:MAG: acylphosphatase [Acidobacteriota bacterium]|nr:acylphosphatase [Blastocatellia bacterium]MDW8411791.1 acylphosphatase [Acidobacteriota bacterium]
MIVARRFIISGRVQGVGFRYFAQRAAIEYHISGYVRNLPTGQVEVVAEGQREAMEAFKRELSIGPYHAQVTSVDETPLNVTGYFHSFRIEH